LTFSVLVVVSGLPFCGCTGTGHNSPIGESGTAPLVSTQTAEATRPVADFAPQNSANSLATTAPVDPAATPYSPSDWSRSLDLPLVSSPRADSLVASVQGAFHAVADTLIPDATVIPAEDPVSLSSGPETVGADLHYQAAQLLETQGNLPGAIRHYHQALEVDGNNFKTLVSLGRLYDRLGDLANAEDYYQRAIHAHPNRATGYNDLGMCYARHGNLPAAQATLERAVAMQPDSARYRNNLASVLVDIGNTTAAFDHLAPVLGRARAHFNLGVLFYQRGHRESAYRHLQLAVQDDPSLEPARHLLAAMAQTGDTPTAIEPRNAPSTNDARRKPLIGDPGATRSASRPRPLRALPPTITPHGLPAVHGAPPAGRSLR
jgi:Tfp pilus assembly protein PilF